MTKKINQDNINTEFKCPVETALDVFAPADLFGQSAGVIRTVLK